MRDGHGHPAVLGYEPFNEPHPAGLAKQYFESHVLATYYREVQAEIRRPYGKQLGDESAFLFAEPRVDWTTYNADGGEFQYLDFTRIPRTFLSQALAVGPDQLEERVICLSLLRSLDTGGSQSSARGTRRRYAA
jgi:hypothetical protein